MVDFSNQHIIPVEISREMKKSYIDYSMLLYEITRNIINSKDNNFQNFKLVK